MTAKTKVKICGLSTPETVTAAIEHGANFIGLVFYPASPRHVDISVASYLARSIPDYIEVVGLFVDPTDIFIQEVLDNVALSMIQLHGEETPERILAVKEKFNLPVIKALLVETEQDLEKSKEYDAVADWLLFDAKGEALPGGNGITFDWNILKDYQGTKPWMLAGGLTPENVGDSLKTISPDSVDVSSGVESAPGVKDATKIQAFLERIKKA